MNPIFSASGAVFCRALGLVGSMLLCNGLSAQSIYLPMVSVGYANNTADGNGRGSVSYNYSIGTYEVTNSQYATFLNAVATTDTFALYSTNMGSNAQGGITRSGSSGSYTYAARTGYADKPVTFVSYWDAARFANWVGTGTTEGRAVQNGSLLSGAAYDLNFVAFPSFTAGNRLAGAAYALPTENEWYKAAYYQPTAQGGPSDSYWLYPTQSDAVPVSAQPGAGTNRGNFYFNDSNGGYAVTQSTSFDGSQVYVTDVGAYSDSASFFGTFDQGGNVYEWNDLLVATGRRVRGGSWQTWEDALRSSYRILHAGAAAEDPSIGFRVASLAPIPEPSTYALLVGVISLGAVMGRRRLRRGTL